MVRLDEYVFGYYRGRVEPDDAYKLANAFLKLGICSGISANGEFYLKRRDKEGLVAYAKNKINLTLSEPLGLYGALVRLRYGYGIILAVSLLVFIFAFSLGRVWDVRIEGNDRLTDTEIEATLEKYGLSVGSLWRKIDNNELENELLSDTPSIAWISVNRRGTVAYVQIIESENVGADKGDAPLYSNIVAQRDGVIEEITVESGVANVKVGDVVRAGDVLISGVVENESGVSFHRAKGSVRASCVANVSAEAMENITQKAIRSHKLREIRLIVFNFSINIFKNYRNYENGCAIIKENRKFALFDRYRLPVRIERIYTEEYEESEYTRSAEEMKAAAERELDGKIYSLFKDADIVKLSTDGGFSGGVYRISARIVYSTDIGEERTIEIS